MNAIVRVLLWLVCFPPVYFACIWAAAHLIEVMVPTTPGGHPGLSVFFFGIMLVVGFFVWILGVIPIVHSERCIRWLSGRSAKDYWLCQRCGYSMRTVPGPVCPECGTEHAIKEQKRR